MARRLAAIMFTDLAGYTALAQADETGALRLLKEIQGLSQPILSAHSGRQVKSMGDGLLIEFPDTLDAVECAVNLQRRLHEYNALKGSQPIRLRVGIHLGDVQEEGSDILGDAVNIASRIEPLADLGGICLSEPVYVQVRNKVAYRFEKVGPKNLKGVREPLDVYRVALPWLAAEAFPADSGAPRLAVLPLANISPESKDEYFADGLTEELITALSQMKGLRVISRTSVNQYRGTTKPVAQIGSELGASWVLEGSVRRAGEQLRISVQLIDARTDEHLWAQTYDRKLENVFSVQGEVAERTAEALRLKLTKSDHEAIKAGPTANLEAWDCYLKAKYFAAQGGRDAFDEAFRWFEKATTKDPSFGVAYAEWGALYVLVVGWWMPSHEGFPKAKVLIDRAKELAPDSAETHTAAGMFALKCDLDWTTAENELLAAITLNPSDAGAHFWHGVTQFTTGRFPTAFEEFRKTVQLDPQNSDAWDWMVSAAFWGGDRESAIALAELQRDRNPSYAENHGRLGMDYWMVGRVDDARREVALMKEPLTDFARMAKAGFLAMLGEPQEAREVLARFEASAKTSYVPLCWIYGLYFSLGENQKGFELLERDEREGDHLLWWAFWVPWFDAIRDDPRFVALLRQRGLPEVRPAKSMAPRTLAR